MSSNQPYILGLIILMIFLGLMALSSHSAANDSTVSRERSLQCSYGGGYTSVDARGYFSKCIYLDNEQ